MLIHINKSEVLHQKLLEELKTIPEGGRVSSVRAIMTRHRISQHVAYQALERLERTGWIIRRPGKGIFRYGSSNSQQLKIALMLPNWPSPIFSEIEEQVLQQGRERNFVVQKFSFPCDNDGIFKFVPVREFDFVLVLNTQKLAMDDVYRILSAPVPVIFIGHPFYGIEFNFVTCNSLKGGLLAADYLYGKGHRKLALMITEPKNGVIKDRADGFLMMAKAHGCSVEVIDANVNSGENSTVKTFERLDCYLAAKHPDFTAMYVLSDGPAGAVFRALATHNIKVPEDVSVIGADGAQLGSFYIPALTTVGCSYPRYVKSILDAIDQIRKNPSELIQIELDPVVIERSSVIDCNFNDKNVPINHKN